MNNIKRTLSSIASNIQTGPFGAQLHQSDYSETGIPVVMPKDLINGKISDDTIARVESDHVERLHRHKIEAGDILYSRRGDVGRCAFATEREAGWLCGTGCLRVTIDPDIADSKYVFYSLQMPKTIGWVINHAVGSTMLNLNTSILGDIPIKLPSLGTQKTIVKILSAYDDLIENNQKQIKLLEEAAQRLYKEWFVDFRFPGHENTPIVDDIPQGWKNGTLGEIALFKRGKTITKDKTCDGGIPVVAGGLEPAYYHNQANTASPVITVSGSGANAGFTRMYHTEIWASDCSFLDSHGTSNLFYTYCLLKSKKNDIDALQKGAAQPHVYAKDLNALEIIVPNSSILKSFNNATAPVFSKIKGLYKQIELSKQARDRLLPELMNGKIEANFR